MAVRRKIAPVGIDNEIDKAMAYFPTALVFDNAFISEWYPRVYVNQIRSRKNTEFQPDHFDHEAPTDNEYMEVFSNDRIDLSCFFLADPTYEFDNETGEHTRRVSMIFQLNLQNLYPGIEHRADEEFQMNVYNMWNQWNNKKRFLWVNVENQIDNVFREFARDEIRFEDMQPRHCVRFNFDVTYVPKCCTDC